MNVIQGGRRGAPEQPGSAAHRRPYRLYGDAAKNLDLSKRRAESVKGALVKTRHQRRQAHDRGLGQTKPMAPNETPQGRAENRRSSS